MVILILKLNKLLLVSIFLLAIISLGAVSAADDDNALAAVDGGDLEVESPVDETIADGGDAAIGDNVTDDNKLGASQQESLAAPVTPKGTIDFDLPLSGSAYVAQWGQPITVHCTFSGSDENAPVPTGEATITFAGETYTAPLENGKLNYTVTKYTKVANNQVFKVVYNGDDNYKSLSQQKNIHVQLNDVVATGAYYGLTPYVEVNLYNATGSVTFTLNGKTYTQDLNGGKAVQEFTNYTLGSNSVKFEYSGDGNYNSISKSLSFTTTANIDAPTIYNFQPAIIKVYMGDATGKVNFTFNGATETVDIINGVATYEAKDYAIGENNEVTVAYSGDNNFNPFSTTKKFTVLDKENATILSSVYKTAAKNMVVIAIPFGTGNVSAIINGKEETLELIEGVAYYNITEGQEIYEINVTYAGNVRLNPANSSSFINLNNVVNNDNYMYYFNQADNGKLFDFIEDGSTLDFQGSIINPDQKINVFLTVSKPVNIISTTGDAYVDLNTTAGSLLGESPGNSFAVLSGGSGSNITGIDFHNTQLWISNTHNVVFDRISNVVEDQRVGSGVGATSIRDNSTYVTIKNSYFYTRNNGGSTTFTFSWASYCTFDNNTVKAEGNVGNLIYLNVYNINGAPTGVPLNNYNIVKNNRVYGKEGSSISVGLMVEGQYNVIANNTLYKSSISTSFGTINPAYNTYEGNVMTEGSGLTAHSYSFIYDNVATGTLSTGADSIVYNNYAGKAMTVGARSEAYNNTVAGFTLSGADAKVHNNIVTGSVATTISQANIQVYENLFLGDNSIKFSNANAKNVNFTNNSVIGYIEYGNANAKGNRIIDNIIVTPSKDYAVDLRTYAGTETTIVNNILSGAIGFGNDAVNHVADTTLTINNYQNESADITVAADPIKVGQNAVVNVATSNTEITYALVVVDGIGYDVNLTDGKGSVEIEGLLANNYNIMVASLDGTYGARNSTVLPVTKNEGEIVVDAPDKTQWIASTITVTVPDATGKVTLSINGTDFTQELDDGIAVFDVPDLVPGEYNFTVAYEGDYKYLENNTNGTLKVNKNKESKFILGNVSTFGSLSKYEAFLLNYIYQPIAGANVTFIINGETINAITDEEGIAIADIALTRGIYPVEVSFAGIEDEYDPCQANAQITIIDKTLINIVSVSGDFKVTGVLKDILGAPIANAVVSYTVNGGEKVNVTTNENGTFVMDAQDDSIVEITFDGDEISLACNASFELKNIKPVRQATEIEVENQFTRYANDFNAGERGAMFYFVLKDGDGNIMANKSAKIGINGVIYSVVTDSEGKAGLQINLAKSTAYTYAIAYLGDDEYNASFAVSKLNLVKKPITITPKKTSYTFTASAKNKYVEATLSTIKNKYDGKMYLSQGKKVTLTINGKTYTATAGKNGAIKFNIGSTTKKGTYKVTIKYAGDGTYEAGTSKTITIKLS